MTTDTPKRRIWIGFDLGGTKMMAVVCDDKLQVLAKMAQPMALRLPPSHEPITAGNNANNSNSPIGPATRLAGVNYPGRRPA